MGLPPHFLKDSLGKSKLAINTKLPPGSFKTGGGITGEFNHRDYFELFPTRALFSNEHQWIPYASPSISIASSAGLVNEGTEEIDFIDNINPFKDGDQILYTSSGAAISGLTSGSLYWIVNSTKTTIQLASTLGGSFLNLSSDGTGVQTFTRVNFSLDKVVPTAVMPIVHVAKNDNVVYKYESFDQLDFSAFTSASTLRDYKSASYKMTDDIGIRKIGLGIGGNSIAFGAGKIVLELWTATAGGQPVKLLARTKTITCATELSVSPAITYVYFDLLSPVSVVKDSYVAVVVRLEELITGGAAVTIVNDFAGGNPFGGSFSSSNAGTSWSSLTEDYSVSFKGESVAHISGYGHLTMSISAVSGNEGSVGAYLVSQPIPKNLRGKNLYGSMEINNLSSSLSAVIKAWDLTNNKKIDVLNDLNGVVSPSTSGKHNFVLYPDNDCASIAIVICYEGTTSLVGASLLVSDIKIGPDANVQSYAVNETPFDVPMTCSWATSELTVKGVKHGKYLTLTVYAKLSGVPSGDAYFTFGSGYQISYQDMIDPLFGDKSKIPTNFCYLHDSSASNGLKDKAGYLTFKNPNGFYINHANDTNNNYIVSTSTLPFAWNVNDVISFSTTIPILGWSSGNVMSTTELALKNVVARVTKSGTQALTGGTTTKLTGFTVVKDVNNVWDATNDRINSPSSQWYNIGLQVQSTPGTTASQALAYRINGGGWKYVGEFIQSVHTGDRFGGNSTDYLNKNDYVEFGIFTSASATVQTGDGNTWATIEAIKDLSVFGVNGEYKAPTIQKFTSGSGTYTKPVGVRHIKIRMIGGGGGGAGSAVSASNGGVGGTANNSTFGSSLLIAGGGSGGSATTVPIGGSGGSNTINSPAISIINSNGSRGEGGMNTGSAPVYGRGGNGANTVMGAGGYGMVASASPASDPGGGGNTNTGAGGGGAATSASTSSVSGAGGGGGGYLEAIIEYPSATYAYSVGGGGSSGSAGTGGGAGGGGGSGIIIVEEYYS